MGVGPTHCTRAQAPPICALASSTRRAAAASCRASSSCAATASSSSICISSCRRRRLAGRLDGTAHALGAPLSLRRRRRVVVVVDAGHPLRLRERARALAGRPVVRSVHARAFGDDVLFEFPARRRLHRVRVDSPHRWRPRAARVPGAAAAAAASAASCSAAAAATSGKKIRSRRRRTSRGGPWLGHKVFHAFGPWRRGRAPRRRPRPWR